MSNVDCCKCKYWSIEGDGCWTCHYCRLHKKYSKSTPILRTCTNFEERKTRLNIVKGLFNRHHETEPMNINDDDSVSDILSICEKYNLDFCDVAETLEEYILVDNEVLDNVKELKELKDFISFQKMQINNQDKIIKLLRHKCMELGLTRKEIDEYLNKKL